jgi:hypothetical protein
MSGTNRQERNWGTHSMSRTNFNRKSMLSERGMFLINYEPPLLLMPKYMVLRLNAFIA